MADNFQAVVMAGGEGERLHPLCCEGGTPKPLLPLVNDPILLFQLRYLQEAGFKSIIVLTIHKFKAAVEEAANAFARANREVTIAVRSVSDDSDTAQALRSAQDIITKDFIIIGCDTITNIPLSDILTTHRYNNSTVTILLKQLEKPKEDGKGGPLVKGEKFLQEYFGLEEGTNRLLYFMSEYELDESNGLLFNQKSLFSRGKMTITIDFLDVHLYVFSQWVIPFLVEKTNISSIKHELLPILVESQFEKPNAEGLHDFLQFKIPKAETQLIDYGNIESIKRQHTNNGEKVKQDITMYFQSVERGSVSDPNDTVRCFAHLVPLGSPSFCMRTAYLSGYLEANRFLMKTGQSKNLMKADTSVDQRKTVNIGSDCIVGAQFECGDQVTVKSSIIGKRCTVGARCKITNCVIMDGATLKDEVNLNSCIVGSSLTHPTIIEDRAKLTDCQIQEGTVVKKGQQEKETQITRDSFSESYSGA